MVRFAYANYPDQRKRKEKRKIALKLHSARTYPTFDAKHQFQVNIHMRNANGMNPFRTTVDSDSIVENIFLLIFSTLLN